MLRQEVYADDAEHPAPRPSRSSAPARPTPSPSRTSRIRTLQPRGGNRHAVFFTHAREAISYHYERNPADPRIQHALTLEVDDFGNVLKQAAIGYGRRRPDRVAADATRTGDKQALVHCSPTPRTAVTNAITDLADHHRTPLPAESRTYELTANHGQRSGHGRADRLYRFDDLVEPRCRKQRTAVTTCVTRTSPLFSAPGGSR